MNFDFIKNRDLDRGTFVIMVGPPGSGKSTIVDKLVNDFNFVKISPNDIREELSQHTMVDNNDVFDIVYSELDKYLSEGFDVVYDATNCRTQYRYQILNTAKKYDHYIICFCSSAPISECLARSKNKDIPEAVIERMYFNLKKHPPTVFEGYDVIMRF